MLNVDLVQAIFMEMCLHISQFVDTACHIFVESMRSRIVYNSHHPHTEHAIAHLVDFVIPFHSLLMFVRVTSTLQSC